MIRLIMYTRISATKNVIKFLFPMIVYRKKIKIKDTGDKHKFFSIISYSLYELYSVYTTNRIYK